EQREDQLSDVRRRRELFDGFAGAQAAARHRRRLAELGKSSADIRLRRRRIQRCLFQPGRAERGQTQCSIPNEIEMSSGQVGRLGSWNYSQVPKSSVQCLAVIKGMRTVIEIIAFFYVGPRTSSEIR